MEGVQWFLPRLLLLSVELGGRKRVCEIKWTPAAYASSSPTTCLPLPSRAYIQPRAYIEGNISVPRIQAWGILSLYKYI